MEITVKELKTSKEITVKSNDLFSVKQDVAFGETLQQRMKVVEFPFSPELDMVTAIEDKDGLIVPVTLTLESLRQLTNSDQAFLDAFPVTQAQVDKEWSIRGYDDEHLDMDFVAVLSGGIEDKEMVTLDAVLTIRVTDKTWWCAVGYNVGEGADYHVDLPFDAEGNIDYDETPFNGVVTKELVAKHLGDNEAFNRGIKTAIKMMEMVK